MPPNLPTACLALLPVILFLIRHLQLSSRPLRIKGCRRLGKPRGQSNLHDEYDDGLYTQATPEGSTDASGRPNWRVKALFTYPLKSCAEVELDAADVVSTGLAYDRHFCFAEYISPQQQPDCAGNVPDTPSKNKNPIEDENGYWTARTLRDGAFSRMALIRPELWVPDPSASDYSSDLEQVQSQGVMVISYPRLLSTSSLKGRLLALLIKLHLLPKDHHIVIPLSPPATNITAYPITPVKIWKDDPLAYNYGTHIPSSLRSFLQPPSSSHGRPRPLTLFRTHPNHHREIFRNAPRKEELGFQPTTGFADAYPLHILNLASVRHVAQRCKSEIPFLSIRRFRANVVVQGMGAFEEDSWRRVVFRSSFFSSSSKSESGSGSGSGVCDDGNGNANETENEIYTVCRTMRCKLPNVDPDTGIRHRNEPDRTLKAYRCIDQGASNIAALGMQGVPATREFTIRVGDAVDVLERGEHFYIRMLKPGEVVEGV